MCDDFDCEQLKEVDKRPAFSVEPEGPQLHQTGDPSHTPSIPLMALNFLAQFATRETSETPTPNEPDQSGKLQRVLANLKIAALIIPDELLKRLVQVVRENLAAFAASPTDLGRS